MSKSSVFNSVLKVLVCIFSFVVFVKPQIKFGNETTTSAWLNCSEHENFQCIELAKCPQVVTFLSQFNTLSPEQKKILRELQCGWDKLQPKICCMKEDLFTENLKSADAIVTKYSGIHLFPSKEQCGRQNLDKILGGTVTQIDDFPWMALLSISHGGSSRYLCGGTLINDRYVITAAHCVSKKNLDHVRLGEWDLDTDVDCVKNALIEECNDPPVDVGIEKAIVHPKYNEAGHFNDIALLRLAKQIKYTHWISPICLPFSSKLRRSEHVNEQLTTSGWGRTEWKLKSPRKQVVKLPVIAYKDCSTRYNEVNVTLTRKQICAGGETGKDSCTGDSGGPLMKETVEDESINWYLVGITSYGPGICGTNRWPGVYTRVASHVDWILSHVEQ